jgi:hypothetical protein
MSLQVSNNPHAHSQEEEEEEQPDPSFAEAAEALASLACSPVRPVIGSSAAVNKRNTTLATKPPRKRAAKQGAAAKDNSPKRRKSIPTARMSASQQQSSPKKKTPPSPHAPPVATAVLRTDPLPFVGAPDPSLLLAALADKPLDGPSRLSLQREVADIRMRYNSSGDLDTLLREARDVDARLKRIGFQVKREDLLTEPNVSHLPSDHPLLPTLLAIMGQGQGQAQAPAAAVTAAVPESSLSFDDPKLAVALLAQQHARSQGLGTSNAPTSVPPLSQLNDLQLLLLRQMQLRQEREEEVGRPDRVDQASLGAQDEQQRELLRMLLLHKLQQQREESALERSPILEQLAPLFQNSSNFSISDVIPSDNQQSSSLDNLLHLIRSTGASQEAPVNDSFPFLGTLGLGSAAVSQHHHFDGPGRSHDASHQLRDLEVTHAGHDCEQLLLRLARQAQGLHQESRSPTLDAASAVPGLADASEQLPLLNLLKAQLILKQQAQQHAQQQTQQQVTCEQDRVVSVLQALQESKQHECFNSGLSEQEQLLGLLLKARIQEQQSQFHDLPSAPHEQQIRSAALVQLAQIQASLQQKAQEEEAAAAAAIQSSLSQGLAQLINNNMQFGRGGDESSNATPQPQVQLLAMLHALQQQHHQ